MDRSAKDILYRDTVSRKTGNTIDIFQIFIILPFARAFKYFSSVATMILCQLGKYALIIALSLIFKEKLIDNYL